MLVEQPPATCSEGHPLGAGDCARWVPSLRLRRHPVLRDERQNTMTVDETFVTMQSLFNPSAAAGLHKTFQFNISGDEAGVWALQVANQTCELIRGGVEKPDITMSILDKDWLAIAEGRLDTMNAFMTGKLKVSGDTMLAMRLQTLFPTDR